jgi:hypothetical protein
MTDRVFATSGDWVLAEDGVQWILLKYQKRKPGDKRPPWRGVSFVRSERDVLARCCREKGVGAEAARLLLEGLPDSYDQWKTLHPSPEALDEARAG